MSLMTVNSLSLSKIADILREQLGDESEQYTFPDDFLKAVADIDFKAIVYTGDTSPYDMVVVGNGLSGLPVPQSQYTPVVKVSSLTGLGTKTIPQYSFYRQTLLSQVTIPSVLTIDKYAFCECTGLTSVVGENVSELYGGSFMGCTSLTNVQFPHLTAAHVDSYSGPFRNCPGLQSVQFGSAGYTFSSTDNSTNVFNGCNQEGLVITIWTVGGNVSRLLTAIRSGATNATIIFKASETTSYDGDSYDVGDIMLTSTPT